MDGTLIEIGLGATTLALAVALAGLGCCLYGLATGAPAFTASARHGLMVNFLLVTLAC